MKALIDTNVFLDVMLNRASFYADSRAIFELVEQRRINAYIASFALTDIFYFVRKEFKNSGIAYEALDKITSIFTVIPVTGTTIKDALALRWKDFEDAVQYAAAKENGIDRIITRNTADFEAADIPCAAPAEFLAAW